MEPVRRYHLVGPASALLLSLMLIGCVVLWVGLPLGWLWVGSQLQGTTSVGTALLAMLAGFFVCVMALVPALGWLNRKHVELREAHDLEIGDHSALEVMLVVSAALAIVGFVVWFFGFPGSSPIPLNVCY
jgi:hypothetical protein